MSKMKQLGCFLMLLGAFALPSWAQTPGAGAGGGAGAPAGGDQGGGGGGRGGRGGGFAQMRQQMMDQLKEKLGATDDEFKALQPKIEQISTLRQDLYMSGMRQMFRGRGGPGGGAGGADRGGDRGAAPAGGAPGADNAQPSVLRAATDALQTTLDDKNAKPEDVKAKLAALRDARTKAKAELGTAQDDLKSLLTSRQEAIMVEYGFIE